MRSLNKNARTGEHRPAPAAEKVPGSQVVQEELSDAPVTKLYVPAAQFKGTPSPAVGQ